MAYVLCSKVKAYLADPSAFAAVAAPAAAAAAAPAAAAAAPAKAEAKEESEESDDDMGFGLGLRSFHAFCQMVWVLSRWLGSLECENNMLSNG